jgi:REP element-mobilizing transposase RayT
MTADITCLDHYEHLSQTHLIILSNAVIIDRPFLLKTTTTNLIGTISSISKKIGCRIYGCCLMTNHVYLIIDPESLSTLMKRVVGRLEEAIIRLWILIHQTCFW